MATATRSDRRAELRSRVQRLRTDFAHWAHRCYRIRTKDQRLVPFALNPVQRAIHTAEAAELARRGEARLYILKARQGGVTTYQQARALHLIWGTPRVDALTMGDKRDRTDLIFEITRRAIDEFPPALLPRLGESATREISFPKLDAHFFTETAGSGSAGRGLTLGRLHCSEFAWYEKPRQVLTAAAPALVPHGSVIALETTGAGFDSEGHNFWREAQAGANGYIALFYPWWECDPLNYRKPLLAPDELGKLAPDEQGLVERFKLTLEQIKFRREKMREMGRSEFLQEYAEDPESCWMATGGMVYDAELLKALMLKAPAPTETHLSGALEVFGTLAPGETAVLGADTAEGTGNDRSAFVIRTKTTKRLLAKYEDRDVAPKGFAAIIDTWGRRFGDAFLVIEKNAHGITVLRHLRDDHTYPLGQIYHRPTLDDSDNERGTRIGWATTGESKPIMVDAARELLNAASEGLVDVPPLAAIRDAFSVRRGDNGRPELNGKDVLVSEMLCWIGQNAPSSTGMLDYLAKQAAELAAARAAQERH